MYAYQSRENLILGGVRGTLWSFRICQTEVVCAQLFVPLLPAFMYANIDLQDIHKASLDWFCPFPHSTANQLFSMEVN